MARHTRIIFIASRASVLAVIIGIVLFFFCVGLSTQPQWDAVESDIADAVVEAEEGRRGGKRAESWRCQEHPDPWIEDTLRGNGERDLKGGGGGGV